MRGSKTFERKIIIISLPINLNICFGCSKEPSHWDGSFEYPQHLFWLRNNKNNFQLDFSRWYTIANTRFLSNQSICKVWSPRVEEMHLQEKTLFDLWLWGQGHMKHCPVPSTSCDLCTCKVWICYVKWFRRRCIYKKKHYLTFDFRVKVTWNIAQYHLLHVTYASAKFDFATSNGLGGDAFTRKYTISPLTLTLGQGHTQNVAQYPLHHRTNAPAKFEVAMS